MRRLILALLLLACSGRSGKESEAPEAAVKTRVPVTMAAAKEMTFHQTVTAPGATQALFEHKVRVPFAGRVLNLHAADGTAVRQGEVLAELISQESEAAVNGAEAMLQSAGSPQEKADAERALKNARAAQVSLKIRAPASGVVLSHAASAGDLVNAGDELLTIADPKAIVFVAQVVQTDLSRIHGGEAASVKLASLARPVPGKVKSVLPSASSTALASPVRIDLATQVSAVGLFGTATIVTGTRANAVGVPESALLRDDVTGVTKVATVAADGSAHWVTVQPGVRENGWVELVGGAVKPGEKMIADGQVGLPEGARVVEAR